MKIHLGCGGDVRPGWVNIDLRLDGTVAPPLDPIIQTDTTFINHDLRTGLPLEDHCCSLIYSSHFFEHLDYKHGVKLMRESHRVLRSGGLFRIVLPDFRKLFVAYLNGDCDYIGLLHRAEVVPEVEPGTETFVDWVNFGVYQFGEHKRIYDEEKLDLLLRRIGFSSVEVSTFQADIDIPSDLRRRYSFYLNAVK